MNQTFNRFVSRTVSLHQGKVELINARMNELMNECKGIQQETNEHIGEGISKWVKKVN